MSEIEPEISSLDPVCKDIDPEKEPTPVSKSILPELLPTPVDITNAPLDNKASAEPTLTSPLELPVLEPLNKTRLPPSKSRLAPALTVTEPPVLVEVSEETRISAPDEDCIFRKPPVFSMDDDKPVRIDTDPPFTPSPPERNKDPPSSPNTESPLFRVTSAPFP